MDRDSELERLRAELESRERSARRLGEAIQQILMVTKTFVSLTLRERDAICDTLNSLVLTFLEARAGAVLLTSEGPAMHVAGRQGLDAASLRTVEATKAFRWVMDAKVAQWVPPARARALWSGMPAALSSGFACVSIDIQDRPVGLVLVGDKSAGTPLSTEELDFLGAASGLAAMALTNASSFEQQSALLADVERQATEARRQAEEKEHARAELDQKLEIIARQQFAIRELSTPILQIWDDVLALPIIGMVDTKRSAEIMERLLAEVTARQSRFVILDITGVEVVDTKTADYFIKVIKAAELLGTTCFLTGIRPAVAQTLVEIGVDLSRVVTLRNLQEGLRECLRRMGRKRSLLESGALD